MNTLLKCCNMTTYKKEQICEVVDKVFIAKKMVSAIRVYYSIFTSQSFWKKMKMLDKWLALMFWLPWKGLLFIPSGPPLGEDNLMGLKTRNHHRANQFHPSCPFPPSHIEAHFPNDFHVTQIGKQEACK